MRTLAAVGHFFSWGLAYGLLFGTWSTTLMFPIVGTAFGMAWGVGIGATCGVLCGLLVGLIQALTFHPDVDLMVYRRRLSLGIGLFVGVSAPILLIWSSEGILWGLGASENKTFLIASLVAVIFWGSLSAAYVAHGHPQNEARFMLNQPPLPELQWGIGPIFWAILSSRALWGIMLFVDLIVAPFILSGRDLISIVLVGTAAVGLMLLFVTLGNAALMMFLKRLLTSNDSMITDSHVQRLMMAGSAAVFTGVVCAWPFMILPMTLSASVICVGLAVLAMGIGVYQAFPLYGKDKRKESMNTIAE